MKYANSEVPLRITGRGRQGNLLAKLRWFVEDSQRRWEARTEKLAERKRLLRTANRRWRRTNGLSLRHA